MTSKKNHLQRYTWEDAIIEAEATDNLSKGAANFALRIARAINWSPEDRDEPGLYWANELAAQAVGVSVRSYYDNAPVLTEAGFWKTTGGNHIPTLPANHKDVHKKYEERTKALTAQYNEDKKAKEDKKAARKAAKATAKVAVPTAKVAVPTAKSAPATAKVAVATASLAGYLVKSKCSVDTLPDEVLPDELFLAPAGAGAVPLDNNDRATTLILTKNDLPGFAGVHPFSYRLNDVDLPLSVEDAEDAAIEESDRGSATAKFAVGTELTLRQQMLMTEQQRRSQWRNPALAGDDDGSDWL